MKSASTTAKMRNTTNENVTSLPVRPAGGVTAGLDWANATPDA